MNDNNSEADLQSLQKLLGKERIETYAKFSHDIFNTTGNSKGDKQVVYKLLDDKLSLLDDNLAQVLIVYLPFMFSHLEPEARQVYAEVVIYFSDLIREFTSGSKAFNLEIEIACREMALTVLNQEDFPERWAANQAILAINYQERILGNPIENLEEAIKCCHNAWQIYTCEAFPEQWAANQITLSDIYEQANAYETCIIGSPSDNLEQRIACLIKALKIYTREEFSELWAAIQNKLGTAYRKRFLGKPEYNLKQAIKYYQEALQIRTCETYPKDYAFTLSNLGFAYQEIRDFHNAYKVFVSAIEIVESLRDKLSYGDQAKQEFDESWIVLYQKIIEICVELASTEPCYRAVAIEYIERIKARNLVELLANREQKQKQREVEAEQRHLDTAKRYLWLGDLFANLNAYVERKIAQGEWPEIAELRRNAPEGEKRRLDVIRSYVSRGSNRFSESSKRISQLLQQHSDINFRLTQKVNPISFKQIQALLPDNQTAIIQWHIDMLGKSFLTFIITRQSEYPLVYQFPQKNLEELRNWESKYIAAELVNQDTWRSELACRLSSLAKILHIDEIFSLLPKACDQVILIPDRFLQLYPLHALPLADGKYFIDKFKRGLRYSPSCQLLQLIKNQPNYDFQNLFAIQNPTGDLHYSSLEVKAIASLFTSAQVFVNNEATKAAVTDNQSLASSHCVHFSCHGIFNLSSPLESRLLLTNNEYLTLSEIFDLNLNQCRLVTLSACETGVTDWITISNEYISLATGFLFAGSPSVVSSLWAVDQVSTAFLFIKLYENLKNYPELKEGDVPVALRDAQNWLRNLTSEEGEKLLEKIYPQIESLFPGKPRSARAFKIGALKRIKESETYPFADPFYWAAFTATGF